MNWGEIIHGIVAKLAKNATRNKTNPISPYLFHLYHAHDVLSPEEIVVYNTGVALL